MVIYRERRRYRGGGGGRRKKKKSLKKGRKRGGKKPFNCASEDGAIPRAVTPGRTRTYKKIPPKPEYIR